MPRSACADGGFSKGAVIARRVCVALEQGQRRGGSGGINRLLAFCDLHFQTMERGGALTPPLLVKHSFRSGAQMKLPGVFTQIVRPEQGDSVDEHSSTSASANPTRHADVTGSQTPGAVLVPHASAAA